ncbi:hypothetical protein [Paenibacillus elgii]|uniref:hypothetical protein n=1 Tax=Paenibacillus elgii TaxID=189691 RepID=UPI000248D914|nr:hypothetical protein [Paenibacillus elgii]
MNEQQIRDMKPGPELDGVLGNLLDITPRTEWWAMDRDEKGIFITFEYFSEAERWIDGQVKSFPEWVEREGCHIVRKEIYPLFSSNIVAAWEVVEKFPLSIIERTEIFVGEVTYTITIYPRSDSDAFYTESSREFPHAVAMAALLALRGGEQQ